MGASPYAAMAGGRAQAYFRAFNPTQEQPLDDDHTHSNFAAMLRTTVLLASLTGLLVVIGAAIGGPRRRCSSWSSPPSSTSAPTGSPTRSR